MLDSDQRIPRRADPDQLVELHLDRGAIAVLGILFENTIRNVTMVVPVLITSCHVSENPKSGPLISHTMTMPAAVMTVEARPAASEVLLASSPKNLEIPERFF